MQNATNLWEFIDALPEPSMNMGTCIVVSFVAIIIGATLLLGNPTKGG